MNSKHYSTKCKFLTHLHSPSYISFNTALAQMLNFLLQEKKHMHHVILFFLKYLKQIQY